MFFSCLLSAVEPANLAEALRDADWVSAMQEDLDQFVRLKVWRLVSRPEGKTIIKIKWIFKNKKCESSLVIRNKARLVAVGYSQQECINYDTTFLNEILKDEVYVGQPPSFVSKQYPDHVYALDKALYGLKQAPRAWYVVLLHLLIDSGFQKDLMVKRFEMSMMGEMKFFLGLQVNQFSNGIFINQSKYILDILKRFGMENCDTVPTPMVEQAKLKLDLIGKQVNHTNYRIMIGSLMYVTSSRPDIMFPTCICARYQCGNILIHGTCLKCNSGAGNSFTYDTIPESFNEVQVIPNPPPKYHFHIYLCQIYKSNSHYGYECSQRVPLVYELEPYYIQNFSDNDYSHDLPSLDPLIDHHCCYKCGNSLNDFFCHHCTCEFCGNGAHILACCDDADDYNSAITPNEPVDSLSMRDEHLNTIPAMESDEFIKSSVKNLVPNPSESEGENGWDMPACFTTFSNILFDADYDFYSVDDQSLSDEDFPKEIYSNPLFDEEIIHMKIDSHPFNTESDLIESMLNYDSSIIISSKIDSLFEELASELTLLMSIPPGIDETDCYHENKIRLTKRLLYDNSSPCPPKEFVSENSNAEIESFSSSLIPVKDSDSLMEEIDLSFTPDYPMPPGIEEDDYDSERDILILEELLDNYSLSLPKNETFYFNSPSSSRPPTKPPDGERKTRKGQNRNKTGQIKKNGKRRKARNKTAKNLWDALARRMLGSEYGEQDKKAAVLYDYETFKATEGELLLDTYIRYLQYATMLKQNKNFMDINIDALYNILKQNQGDVNDAMRLKKKTVVVTFDPLALIDEKTKVSKSKEKVVVSLDSEGRGSNDVTPPNWVAVEYRY
nr:putative ribonuclease H-like domain-containing protein [Tanacetum cinerariifolium]